MLKRSLFPLMLVALLAACGNKQEAAPAPAAQGAVPAPATQTAAAPAAADNPQGEKVFKTTCALCHAAGVGGAPKVGDKADWAPRVAQGKDTLYTHAIAGFTGQKGAMPPKGGNPSLPDADVKAAVDYMASKAM